ncbi:hypothetical protein ACXIZN_16180 [Amycolatopsis sp. TRM77291]
MRPHHDQVITTPTWPVATAASCTRRVRARQAPATAFGVLETGVVVFEQP